MSWHVRLLEARIEFELQCPFALSNFTNAAAQKKQHSIHRFKRCLDNRWVQASFAKSRGSISHLQSIDFHLLANRNRLPLKSASRAIAANYLGQTLPSQCKTFCMLHFSSNQLHSRSSQGRRQIITMSNLSPPPPSIYLFYAGGTFSKILIILGIMLQTYPIQLFRKRTNRHETDIAG